MNDERIEEFLKGVALPEYESDEHRRQLRGQILHRLEAKRGARGKAGRWKIAALVLGFLCVAAVAVEVARVAMQANRVRFEGRARDGSYHFATESLSTNEDGSVTVTSRSRSSLGSGGRELGPDEIEQMRRDVEEIEALRQRGAGEVVEVTDITVNGRLNRNSQFRYVLADGRAKEIGEGDPDAVRNRADRQVGAQEVAELRQRGQREVEKIVDTEFNGQVQRTLICRYVLPDGREVTAGEGDPDQRFPTNFLTSKQLEEMWRLVGLQQGTFLGTAQTQVFGKTFTFKKYAYQLADGTVVNHAETEPQGRKTSLNKSDYDELSKLKSRRAGTTLETYTATVKGKVFKFAPVRYVLHDGTVVISAHGVPQGERPVARAPVAAPAAQPPSEIISDPWSRMKRTALKFVLFVSLPSAALAGGVLAWLCWRIRARRHERGDGGRK